MWKRQLQLPELQMHWKAQRDKTNDLCDVWLAKAKHKSNPKKNAFKYNKEVLVWPPFHNEQNVSKAAFFMHTWFLFVCPESEIKIQNQLYSVKYNKQKLRGISAVEILPIIHIVLKNWDLFFNKKIYILVEMHLGRNSDILCLIIAEPSAKVLAELTCRSIPSQHMVTKITTFETNLVHSITF